MNELINDVQWLACVLLFICAICDANDDLGAYTACRYSYDGTGNRTEKDCDGQKTRYVYNQLDQLTEEQTATDKTTYRWDGRGNLIEKQTPAQTTRYTWSSDNRLMQASDGSTTVSYGYDALGRRISRTKETGAQKEETQWVLDTARPYSEIVLERTKQNGGAWQETRYTHTPDGVGQLISEQRQGKTLHVYEDGQGSARLITDESGQIIETLDFDAFGNESNPDPASPTRHRYTGESYDSITGLYHLRARDYDPKTGRFISMDEHPGSQSIPLTLNKYLYGNADPVNHIDPSGNIGLLSVSINVDFSSTLRMGSVQEGRAALAKILFGHPPRDIGIVGEMVLDWALRGFETHLDLMGKISKQEFGQKVHKELRKKCDAFGIRRDVTLKCEPFFISDNKPGQILSNNPKGSLGVDILILYNKKPVIALELKTGRGMSHDGFQKRKKWIGTSVVQITIHAPKDKK